MLAQTYQAWELILVDDGSTDASTEIATKYVTERPGQVKYVEHSGHINAGMSSSRNLGIKQAKGRFIALLDADDVWIPNKLKEQVTLFEANAEAGMLYGRSQYWYSWNKNLGDSQQDFVPGLGILSNSLIQPPHLLPLFLCGKTAVPCPSSILLRRSIIKDIGGFVDEFRSLYEDQAFYAKVCLEVPIYVSDKCWDKYRQHPQGSTNIARVKGQEIQARLFFLRWLVDYLYEKDVKDLDVWLSVVREIWLVEIPNWFPRSKTLYHLARWIKKWVLRVEEKILPSSIRQILWTPREFH